jgi:hypothetical protein
MGKFGLFNPNILQWNQEENNDNHRRQQHQHHGHHRDDPEEERRPILHLHSISEGASDNSNNNNNNNNRHRPPRTIEYGSVLDQAVKSPSGNENNDGKEVITQGEEEKTVTWHDYDNNNDLDYDRRDNDNDQDATFSANGSTGTAGTMGDSSAIPSMTAAFQAVENRTIVLYCLFYVVTYMIMAVIAYSYVFEHWTIIDSLYFAVATL